MIESKQPRVLTIAGSDSSGGAGIQADIKTITVLGGYAASAITAITAQNTSGVDKIFPVPAPVVSAQIAAVLEDIGADAIKIGMLATADIANAVADVLRRHRDIPIILDPLMSASAGEALLDGGALEALKTRLIPLAILITPNIPEAEKLTGMSIKSDDDVRGAAAALLKLGCGAVLLTGGHGEGDQVHDYFLGGEGGEMFTSKRIKTRNSHGTGCTLSSAIALFVASGLPLKKAVALAREYVLKAMVSAPGLGKGDGPLGHNLGRNLID